MRSVGGAQIRTCMVVMASAKSHDTPGETSETRRRMLPEYCVTQKRSGLCSFCRQVPLTILLRKLVRQEKLKISMVLSKIISILTRFYGHKYIKVNKL